MCMLTFIGANARIPVEGLANGATWNNDGHGWAIAAATGKMITGKSLDYDEAIAGFVKAREETGPAPSLFHSRWATTGSVREENCHPFPVGRYAVMAHNGVLPHTYHPSRMDDDRSDSQYFADEYMMRISPRGTFSRRERVTIANMIGRGNKFVILSVSPKLQRPRGYIVNREAGVDIAGVWFSNRDFEHRYTMPARHRASTGYSTGYGLWDDDWRDEWAKGEDGIWRRKPEPVKATGWEPFHDMPYFDSVDEEECYRYAMEANLCPWCWSHGTINKHNVCSEPECHVCVDCMGFVGTSCKCFNGSDAMLADITAPDKSRSNVIALPAARQEVGGGWLA